MRLSDLRGRRVVILGTGREGMAAANALVGVASALAATDDKPEGDSAAAWRARWGASVPILGTPTPEQIRADFDVAVKSPGISPLNPLVAALVASGFPLTSGTDLWMSDHAATTIGVTGSKGKSTTSSLIHHVLAALGENVVLGGNIGLPLLDLPEADRSVVELSSYQSQSLSTSPGVAVLTSLFAEHLDWHGSEERYFADKLSIVAHGPHRVVANGDDPRLVDALARLHPDVPVQWVGANGEFGLRHHDGEEWISRGDEHILPATGLRLLGRHNALNACIALAAIAASGTSFTAEQAAEALASFAPLDHRLQPIADPSGVTFVNDSLSTSPFAAIEALKSFDPSLVVLLVGGQDRGVDYAPLADHLAQHPVAAVIGLPPSGPRILSELRDVPTQLADDMRDAVDRARRAAPERGIVLLSPAAPSYGIYRDFADRAADFERAISATRPA